MRVRCTYRRGDQIPDEVLALGNTPSTHFDVKFDFNYVVYAVSLWRGVLHYLLVIGTTNRPDWYPSFLFEVSNPEVPSCWFIARGQEQPGLPADVVWGYHELALSGGQHYIDLIEREPEALRVFEQRRFEIETDEGK